MDNKYNEEKIFFQQKDVLVSQSRLMIGEKTYALRNISAVSTATNHWVKKPNRTPYKLLIALALILLYAQYESFVRQKAINVDTSTTFYVMTVIYIAVIIFAIYKMLKLKAQYFYSYLVRISSNSGTSDVLSSPDKEYIHKVVEALNQAIIYRG